MGLHTVQFVGKKATLLAFEKKDIVNWSFWQGKQMLFAYEGTDATESSNELQEWIDVMSKGTNAVYTLKFYKEVGRVITPTTADTGGSFNFRLYVDTMENPGGEGRVGGLFDRDMSAVMGEIQAIRKEWAEEKQKMLAKKDDPERLETWEKILDHPITMAGIGKFFNLDVKGFEEAAAKINGVPGYSIQESISILQKSDDKLEEHLYKLAVLSEKKPANFKTMMGMLDQMSV